MGYLTLTPSKFLNWHSTLGWQEIKHIKNSKLSCNSSSEMFEVNVTSSSLNLTNLANFTTDLVRLDLDTSELEIKMNVSKMRVIFSSNI